MPRHSPSGTRAYLGSHQWRQSVFPLLQCAFSRIGFPGRPPPDKATGDALVLPAVVGKDAGTTSSLSQSISKPSEHLSRWDPVAAALPSSGLLLTRRLGAFGSDKTASISVSTYRQSSLCDSTSLLSRTDTYKYLRPGACRPLCNLPLLSSSR